MKFQWETVAAVMVGLMIGSMITAGGLTLIGRSQPAAIIITPAPPTATPQPSATPGPIAVDVGGQVVRPGVYTLPPNSRIEDAISAAGGYVAAANTAVINLAQPLTDGAKVYVPDVVEAQPSPQPYLEPPILAQAAPLVGNNTGPSSVSGDGPINLNAATVADLQTLPGIGPSTAQKIIDYRDENGHFGRIEDIMNVSGIGQAKFDKMQPFIQVGD